MKNEPDDKVKNAESTEMLPEYDFESMKLQQGRTYGRIRKTSDNRVVDSEWRARGGRILSPEIAEKFKDDDAVNDALREYLRLKQKSA